MQRIQFFLILVAFVGWAVLCNWWYLCKIKKVCGESSQTTAGLAQLKATTATSEPVVIEVEEESNEVADAAASVETIAPTSYTYTTRFQFDSEHIVNSQEFTNWLAEVPGAQEVKQIQVIGHTCDLGSDEYNLRLGMRRAMAVKEKMVRSGVPADKIIIESRGKESPLNSNSSDSDREKNRRAEISFEL